MAALKPFAMPKWGIEMTEGTIAEWLVAEGEPFERGKVLTAIETDKITNEVEAEAPGQFARIVATPGQTYPVGALLAVLADGPATDAEIEAFLSTFKAADALGSAGRDTAPPVPPEPAPAAAPAATTIPDDVKISPAARRLAEDRGIDVGAIAGSGKGGRISLQDVDQAGRPPAAGYGGAPVSIAVEDGDIETVYASPLAKRLARQHGINLSGMPGSGPRGRICKADVLAKLPPAAAPAPAPTMSQAPAAMRPAAEIVPMDKIRRIVARRLTEAKQAIPHFYVRMEARADALVALRAQANLFLGARISINDFIVRAAALALVEEPECNVQVHGDTIHRFAYADVAVAIASDKGLVTPIVRNAEALLPQEIGERTKVLIARAAAGRLSHEDMDGGSFTVSNLGMFGVDGFDAIINPPQGAILAVGGSRRVFAEQADGSGAFESRIAFTLSCDHRAIDGAAGARYLAALKRLIEAPEALFRR
ncbi:dihydrolipoamide acetyltransferase family protein [Sphingomonas jatrophae]|uniref:Dihydrolipoamide acetyltransferase component of pyruvate dehydrogenase complex n=1 Tax=Sphingomonas jatrophae TaxID=1166337 RepID=A0A1I6M1Y9_9SPHN|nr:dihydrolipoamide acetyltransferase family protein [Sphingomonas jatrophae]SFS09512.1 pyruvate dehydrogenase E2 component (dihydrolipoamide acetyltransferase) [Sphingomonas jatrophae]